VNTPGHQIEPEQMRESEHRKTLALEVIVGPPAVTPPPVDWPILKGFLA
jgi:hypothetical protein